MRNVVRDEMEEEEKGRGRERKRKRKEEEEKGGGRERKRKRKEEKGGGRERKRKRKEEEEKGGGRERKRKRKEEENKEDEERTALPPSLVPRLLVGGEPGYEASYHHTPTPPAYLFAGLLQLWLQGFQLSLHACNLVCG